VIRVIFFPGRFAYLNIYQMFPRKSEKIKASLHSTLRSRLTKAEEELVQSHPISSSSSVASASSHTTASASAVPASPPRKLQSSSSRPVSAAGAGGDSKATRSPNRSSPKYPNPHSPSSSAHAQSHSPSARPDMHRSKSASSVQSSGNNRISHQMCMRFIVG
jgi:hypothetical protein